MFSQMKQRTARKAHVCSLCQEPIKPGQKYYEYTGLYNDRFFGERYHLGCERLIMHFNTEVNDEDDYSAEDIWTWIRCEYCQQCSWQSDCMENPTRCARVRAQLSIEAEED